MMGILLSPPATPITRGNVAQLIESEADDAIVDFQIKGLAIRSEVAQGEIANSAGGDDGLHL
jgi:hypothetical protein